MTTSHLPNVNAKSMVYFTLSFVMLNAIVDTNDMFCQVVNLKCCVMHQIVCPENSKFSNSSYKSPCHYFCWKFISRNSTIHSLLKNGYSAEQSNHQLLVLLLK
jgi:hypothetical protein